MLAFVLDIDGVAIYEACGPGHAHGICAEHEIHVYDGRIAVRGIASQVMGDEQWRLKLEMSLLPFTGAFHGTR